MAVASNCFINNGTLNVDKLVMDDDDDDDGDDGTAAAVVGVAGVGVT